nr:YoaK family protein [uncultured Faecalimonas sp.]
MKRSKQMSESMELGILLALSGGFMDAYSYLYRDHVFANAQTGNILLFGVHLAEKNWAEALHYLFPISAFVIGIALAEMIRMKTGQRKVHWRQICVLLEACVLASVACFPQSMNTEANSLISCACGIQVETFRKIRGQGIATTMCVGNLRSATQSLCEYWHTKNKKAAERGMLYYGIIFCFVIGAVLGNICINYLKGKAILVCVGLLAAVFLLMFVDKEKEEKETVAKRRADAR